MMDFLGGRRNADLSRVYLKEYELADDGVVVEE